MSELELSPVVPEARIAVAKASRIWLRHFEPWLVGLLLHGSALKGGFIPGGSDIDFQIYLADEAFDPLGHIPLDRAIAVHRDLAAIDVRPFQYIQCYPRRVRLGGEARDSMGPIPGTYHMIAGRLPVPEATAEEVLARARATLGRPRAVPFPLADNLLEHGGGRLERQVRYLCTDVWPVLYSVLSLQEEDPLGVWRLTKAEAIALLRDDGLRATAAQAHEHMWAYYTGGETLGDALALIEAGVAFLEVAHAWWRERTAPG